MRKTLAVLRKFNLRRKQESNFKYRFPLTKIRKEEGTNKEEATSIRVFDVDQLSLVRQGSGETRIGIAGASPLHGSSAIHLLPQTGSLCGSR